MGYLVESVAAQAGYPDVFGAKLEGPWPGNLPEPKPVPEAAPAPAAAAAPPAPVPAAPAPVAPVTVGSTAPSEPAVTGGAGGVRLDRSETKKKTLLGS